MGLPAIYPFEKLPVYHNTNTLANALGSILASRDGYEGLDKLDEPGQAFVEIVKTISQLICLTNAQTEADYPLSTRQQACDMAIEATRCCRRIIEDFCAREDGDPVHLGRAAALTQEIEKGLRENRKALKPGFDPGAYAARFAVPWPIDDRGRPLMT
jgi:hypothetical protein